MLPTACLNLVYASRRQNHVARQRERRRRECELRRRTAELLTPLSRKVEAKQLGVACRTLREWRYRQRLGTLQPRTLGRPCKESPRDEKLAALKLMHREGPHVGLPTLRGALPNIPRCQWIDLQKSYRRWWRDNRRCGQQRLHWHRAGTIWAVDFSTPTRCIDGRFPRIFAVRDLASGMQSAWLPVLDETASTAVAAIEELLHQHGSPLVIKSDNGSAFRSGDWKDCLDRAGVTPLYSPPITPRYNGSCEASNGSMKLRTTMLASSNEWTSAQLEDARRQANKLHRAIRHTSPTAHERWIARESISDEARRRFQQALDEQRTNLHNQVEEGRQLTTGEQARLERKAVTQALVERGILSVTWRSIPLPFIAAKTARIS